MDNGTLNHRSTLKIPQNYSILINKLEQLALGLDSALGNFTIDRKEVEISVGGSGAIISGKDRNDGFAAEDILFDFGNPIASGRAPPPRVIHGMAGAEEYSRVVSDIWIGVILTLLIVTVIFFICACFLYHKFQQWKNSYRANHFEPVEICRRLPSDCEIESLPSYTIVSGLPTYDDALEEYRKTSILLTSTVVPVIKIFEADFKEPQIYGSHETALTDQCQLQQSNRGNFDNITGSSTAAASSSTNNYTSSATTGLILPVGKSTSTMEGQIIELSPENLASISQKRLSLQIAVNNSISRNSKARLDLRNSLLRSRATRTAVGIIRTKANMNQPEPLPPIPRSLSVSSLINERNLLDKRLQHLHHRGSLC